MDVIRATDILELVKNATAITLGNLIDYAPRVGKIAVCALFLVNIKSWPLVWHMRVFRFAYMMRLRHKLVMLGAMFKTKKQKEIIEDKWLASITPIGKNPLTFVVPFRSWASIDDSDFNGHLSNSSYGKVCDSARFKAGLASFPRFFPIGGWMALAATHSHYIREIPMFASFEVRTSVVAWDQKWIYVMSKFVRQPSSKKKQQEKSSITPGSNVTTPMVPLRTPADGDISVNGTPFPGSTPAVDGVAPVSTEKALNAVAAGLAGSEPDGATLHTVVVSQMCFKIGRITVPPALVLAINGHTHLPGYSHTTPPPEWAKVQELMCKPFGGSTRKMRKFLEGGWREVPEAERWWEQALGGEIEEQRATNLQRVQHLRQGLEAARTL